MKIFGFFVDQSKRLMALVILIVLLTVVSGIVSGSEFCPESGSYFSEEDCPICEQCGIEYLPVHSSSYTKTPSGYRIEELRCHYGKGDVSLWRDWEWGGALSICFYTDEELTSDVIYEDAFGVDVENVRLASKFRSDMSKSTIIADNDEIFKYEVTEYRITRHIPETDTHEYGFYSYNINELCIYQKRYAIYVRVYSVNEETKNNAMVSLNELVKCAKEVVDKKEGASKKDCEEYCKNTYVRKGAEVSGEGKYPDCTCVVDHKDKLGRLTRTEKISGGKKTTYIFDPETEGLLSVCPNRKREIGENCFNCPQDCKCGPNEICDPSSKATNPVTKCSPKVAYIYISSGITPYERIWINDHINDIRDDYQRRGYKVIQVKVYNAKQMLQTLSNPSTKAIAYFGHGVDPIHWFGFSEPRIEGIDAATMEREMYDTLYKKYRDLGIDREEANKKADERSKNANLDYAYIHACHSLDDTSLRDYLVRSGGVYSGKKGGLWGSQKPRDSVKP